MAFSEKGGPNVVVSIERAHLLRKERELAENKKALETELQLDRERLDRMEKALQTKKRINPGREPGQLVSWRRETKREKAAREQIEQLEEDLTKLDISITRRQRELVQMNIEHEKLKCELHPEKEEKSSSNV